MQILQLVNSYPALERGILYIVFNESFVKEMLNSARSVRIHNPDLKICVMSNFEFESDDVDYYIKIKPNHIRAKVDFICHSPFKETLYLDSDTIINKNIEDTFDVLKKFDIAGIHDFARKREKYAKKIPKYDAIPYSFSEINGGVMCWKHNDATRVFFSMWQALFYEYFHITNGWDQVSLRIALWESDVRLIHLPIEYNVRGKENREKVDFAHIRLENGKDHMMPRIFHMHVDKKVHNGIYDVSYEDAVEHCKTNHYKY